MTQGRELGRTKDFILQKAEDYVGYVEGSSLLKYCYLQGKLLALGNLTTNLFLGLPASPTCV
jgi:hypothetical protein